MGFALQYPFSIYCILISQYLKCFNYVGTLDIMFFPNSIHCKMRTHLNQCFSQFM
eukprot:c40344_g1_i1 orf=137-301(+)